MCVGAGGFGFGQDILGFISGCACDGFAGFCGLKILRRFGEGRRCIAACRNGALGFGFVFCKRFAVVINEALCGLVTCGQTRHVFGYLTQRGFAIREDLGPVCGCNTGILKAIIMPGTRLGNLTRFPFQTLNRFARVFVEASLAFHIKGQLCDAVGQDLDGLFGAGFLVGQRVTLNMEALQDGGGDGFFFAQGR